MVISADEKKDFFSSLKTNFPTLSTETVQSLFIFCELLVQHNDEYDLSRLKRFSDIITKHFIDSLIVGTLIDLPDSLLDIGTGAGFPGIPLKIAHPNLRLVLGEPRPMRCTFMKMVIDQLTLTDTTVFSHKVNEKMRFPVSNVITRAFESTPATLERCLYFLPKGGKIILLKGPGVDQEMEETNPTIAKHYILDQDIDYTLPNTEHKRRLIVYKKISNYTKRFFQFSNLSELTYGESIGSAENKRVRELKKWVTKGAGKSGIALVCGSKIVSDTIAKIENNIEFGLAYEGYEESEQRLIPLIDSLEKRKKLLVVKKSLFNDLDILSNRQMLFFYKFNTIEKFTPTLIDNVTIAIPFQDPANMGSVIRSAVAFGITTVLITKESCHPFHPKSIRSSGGAVFKVRFLKASSLSETAEELMQHAIPIFALDKGGIPIANARFPKKFVIIPGIEGPGLPENLKKHSYSVPMSDEIESLNAAVTTSIVLYEYYRQNH